MSGIFLILGMKFLYVFPHPDDESFGPASAIAKQKREGHEVYLFTLTKGGATRMRHKFGYSIEEMGEIRYKEMQGVARVLDLDGMEVRNLTDSGLKEMEPQDIEQLVREHILRIRPDVLITYAVHGISGFHDHLVAHAIVKRVFVEMKNDGYPFPKRLALFTLDEAQAKLNSGMHKLSFSKPEEIDCVVKVSESDQKKLVEALGCYETYQEIIQGSILKNPPSEYVCFEFFQENMEPPSDSLTGDLSG
jgi:LmbE family N-acetylglucosaminyl deacetylase